MAPLKVVPPGTSSKISRRPTSHLCTGFSGDKAGPNFKGVRVTPNVYTVTQDLGYFCEVMEGVSKKGLPK